MGDAAELLDSIVAVLLVIDTRHVNSHLGLGAHLVLHGAHVCVGVVVRQFAHDWRVDPDTHCRPSTTEGSKEVMNFGSIALGEQHDPAPARVLASRVTRRHQLACSRTLDHAVGFSQEGICEPEC